MPCYQKRRREKLRNENNMLEDFSYRIQPESFQLQVSARKRFEISPGMIFSLARSEISSLFAVSIVIAFQSQHIYSLLHAELDISF